MRRRPVVFDASVLIPVLLPTTDDDDAARAEAALGDPDSDVIAPTLIDLEVLNAAARRRNVDADALVRIAGYLEELDVERIDPSLADVARWCAAGLSAYDATYAALAEELDALLLTADRALLDALPERAIAAYPKS